MKLKDILQTVVHDLTGIAVGGKCANPKLARLDRGILKVAVMVAALDGEILPEEYAAFETLAKKCRGYTPKNAGKCLDEALRAAGYLIATAQVGVYDEKARIAAFVSRALEAMPFGFSQGSRADIRRAFALWMAMGLSDGQISSIERQAILALRDEFTTATHILSAASVQLGAGSALGIRPVVAPTPVFPSEPLLGDDFFAHIERLLRRYTQVTADSSRRADALAAFIKS